MIKFNMVLHRTRDMADLYSNCDQIETISCHCFLFIPPENIRKPLVLCFQGDYRKIPVVRNVNRTLKLRRSVSF